MNDRCRKAKRRHGFTIIEVMVVIVIIVLLIAILIPVLSYAKKLANNSATQATLQIIATGLDKYYSDFNVYPPSQYSPPSTPPQSPQTSWPSSVNNRGSVMLAEALEGFLPFANDGAGPDNTLNPSDPIYGFRTNISGNGTIYGPYVSPDPKILYNNPNSATANTVEYFIDVWGHEILYYRAVPGRINGRSRSITQIFDTFSGSGFPGSGFDAVFVKDDNSAAIDPWSLAPGQTATPILDPSTFTAANVAPADRPFWHTLGSSKSSNAVSAGDLIVGRDSYLLLSAGYDGKFFTADDQTPPRK